MCRLTYVASDGNVKMLGEGQLQHQSAVLRQSPESARFLALDFPRSLMARLPAGGSFAAFPDAPSRGGLTGLLDTFIKGKVLAVQEFTELLFKSVRHAFSRPRYVIDTLVQMDIIGFGSLPIVLLTGFFTGGVLALQTYRTLGRFGET
ncbi:MAG: ABC transporter permease, partial [Acidobacteria bacterium]|nr:ABC transporter permease [Acidobacteriota bacterium]